MWYAHKYSDIWLVPSKCAVESRSQAQTDVNFGGYRFKVPVVPANMLCSIDERTSDTLISNDYFYIYHRFGDTLQFCRNKVEQKQIISISLGVKREDHHLIETLNDYEIVPDYITIDIAHGHAPSVVATIHKIRHEFGKTPFIIAGNVCTSDGVKYLEDGGADAVKVGIGQGKACTTKYKTGFTVPMFTCVQECATAAKVPLIADGGIEHNGDITKALVAGATMVMAGGMFASLYDSPAPSLQTGEKEYFGSASARTKTHISKSLKNIEGTTKHIPENKMTYLEKMIEIQEDLQSSISYAGGIDCSCLTSVDYRIHPEST